MRDYHYEIDVSEGERELALSAVQELFESLDTSPAADVPMANPALTFAAYHVQCCEFESEKGGKFLLVFDIATFTNGKLREVTPRQLKTLLFNSDVFEDVVLAMVDVLTWSADAEWHGYTASNERAVVAAFNVIVDAVVMTLETRLVRAPLQ